jgi:uncharacterized repeat protein (TIGR01451 family)
MGAFLVGLPGGAFAFLDTGTLLTNSASAAYEAPPGQASSVSYSATAKILVANPSVFLWKDVTPTQVLASVGGLVQFTICFSNGGANTAFNLTINDKLPNNTYWWNSHSSWFTNLSGAVDTTTVVPWWSTSSATGPWNPPGTLNIGQGQPLWIQWTVPNMGVGMSGCIQFTASVG